MLPLVFLGSIECFRILRLKLVYFFIALGLQIMCHVLMISAALSLSLLSPFPSYILCNVPKFKKPKVSSKGLRLEWLHTFGHGVTVWLPATGLCMNERCKWNPKPRGLGRLSTLGLVRRLPDIQQPSMKSKAEI